METSYDTTERLILRAPCFGDLDTVFAIHADPATNQFNPAGPHQSIEDSRRMLLEWLVYWERHQFGYWTITTAVEPQQVIGFGGLMYKDIQGETRPNLYFRFRPSAWGRGFATEMGRAAKHIAFEILNLDQIVATVRPNNTSSIRALERIGMVYRGNISDDKGISLFYALYRNETTQHAKHS